MNVQLGMQKVRRWIWVGMIADYFALLVVTLRNFLVWPAHGYPILVPILLVGFLPSLIVSWLKGKYVSYIAIVNALVLVSCVFFLIGEWALSGAFVLVPIYALLFEGRKTYIFGSAVTLLALIGLSGFRLAAQPATKTLTTVNIVDSVTIYLILIFLIYFIVGNLLQQSVVEAKRLQTILALAKSVEARHPYTYGHSDRVASIAKTIAAHLGAPNPETVYNSGLIHDVGKLNVPDAILNKPDKLSDEEYALVKRHPVTGAEICRSLDIPSTFIDGVLHHHERWDGGGYPYGLKGDDIPLTARILSVADSIDAMSSARAYRQALDLEYIRNELSRCSGTQFDPGVAAGALVCWDAITPILTGTD